MTYHFFLYVRKSEYNIIITVNFDPTIIIICMCGVLMVHTFCRYPYRNECSQHTFFTYYFCDAVGKTWSALTSCTLLSISSLKSSSHSPPPSHTHTHTHRQSLYDNEQQVQDHFTMFWEQVARRFKNNPYVLGGPLPPPPPSLPSLLPPFPPPSLPSSLPPSLKTSTWKGEGGMKL